MNQTIVTKSPEETQALAHEFAKSLKDGAVVLLFGNLGAGKTSFMQGMAQGLGIKQRIISPTFIIMRKYDDQGSRLYHIDLYRTDSKADLESLGLEEVLQEKNAIVAIEWPEKLGSFLPEKRIEIRFETISENERKIEITYVS